MTLAQYLTLVTLPKLTGSINQSVKQPNKQLAYNLHVPAKILSIVHQSVNLSMKQSINLTTHLTIYMDICVWIYGYIYIYIYIYILGCPLIMRVGERHRPPSQLVPFVAKT